MLTLLFKYFSLFLAIIFFNLFTKDRNLTNPFWILFIGIFKEISF